MRYRRADRKIEARAELENLEPPLTGTRVVVALGVTIAVEVKVLAVPLRYAEVVEL